jgi:hypothetical protein
MTTGQKIKHIKNGKTGVITLVLGEANPKIWVKYDGREDSILVHKSMLTQIH